MANGTDTRELTVAEAARWLGISADWVRKLCDRGDLPHRRIGPGWRLIPETALKEYAQRREKRRHDGV